MRNRIRAKRHPLPSPRTFKTKNRNAVKSRCIHGEEYKKVSMKKMEILVRELRLSLNDRMVCIIDKIVPITNEMIIIAGEKCRGVNSFL